MTVDLFSMVLNAGISWGVSRLLNTVVDCTRCGNPRVEDISNLSLNSEYCTRCGNNLNQYVNASEHTVNRNRSIVSAHISRLYWPRWQGTFHLYYDLDIVNSKYESIVAKLQLSRFQGGVFHEFDYTMKPTYENTQWRETWIKIPQSNFPQEPCIVAVDLTVYNLWGDYLCNARELMEYGIRKNDGCFLTTMACRLHGRSDDCFELQMARKFRDEYLAKHIDISEFKRLYVKASTEVLCNSRNIGILEHTFESYIAPAAALVHDNKYDAAMDLILQFLQMMYTYMEGNTVSMRKLCSFLKNEHRTSYPSQREVRR